MTKVSYSHGSLSEIMEAEKVKRKGRNSASISGHSNKWYRPEDGPKRSFADIQQEEASEKLVQQLVQIDNARVMEQYRKHTVESKNGGIGEIAVKIQDEGTTTRSNAKKGKIGKGGRRCSWGNKSSKNSSKKISKSSKSGNNSNSSKSSKSSKRR
tara:strand:- start:61 stop:525 length:465 start_codon:yes stop_codon:yes gene_type:complete